MKTSFYLTAEIRIKRPEDIPLAAERLAEIGRLSREEEGCLSFHAAQNTSDKSRFIIWEQFADEAAFDVHFNTSYVKEWFAMGIEEQIYISKLTCEEI